MRPDQDWTDVWPTAQTYNPSVVPLPIRQGKVKVRWCLRGSNVVAIQEFLNPINSCITSLLLLAV